MAHVPANECLILLVALLVIDALRPLLVTLITQDLIDCRLLVSGIVVHTTEMVPMVLLFAVLALATGEVIADPGVDLVLVADELCAVVGVDLGSEALLLAVGRELVVEDGVPVDADAVVFGGVRQLQKLLLRTPFCRYGTLLVKFTQVVAFRMISKMCWLGRKLDRNTYRS